MARFVVLWQFRKTQFKEIEGKRNLSVGNNDKLFTMVLQFKTKNQCYFEGLAVEQNFISSFSFCSLKWASNE